jgi:hypothetical protein
MRIDDWHDGRAELASFDAIIKIEKIRVIHHRTMLVLQRPEGRRLFEVSR